MQWREKYMWVGDKQGRVLIIQWEMEGENINAQGLSYAFVLL